LPLGASLSVLLAGGIMGIGAILFLNVVGKNFLSGAVNSYVASLGGSTTTPWYGFYPAPYFDLFVSIANPNPIVTILVGIGFICWILYYPGLDCLMNTRAVLAWSFDRLGPSWLGKVSDRFHTPIRAVAVFSVLNWLALVIFSLNFSLTGSLSATLAVFVTMFLFMGIVGLVFPYLRKTKPIFESSAVKWKIGRVPVLTIAAIGWVLFLSIGTVYYLTEPALAAYSPLMLTISAIVFFAAFPIYYVVKAYRKSQGFDITLAYAEIPPE
jgi:amino acid transporter